MKNEIIHLCNCFPNLYKNLKHWGCGSGWFPLITDLSKELEDIILRYTGSKENFYATDIKEKFGTLRFYMNRETDEMSDVIDEYENKSSRICEECGKDGNLQLKDSWWITRCSDCLNKMSIN